MVDPLDGERFLRALAGEVLAEEDVRHWWSRFSSAFQALDLVGAVDETVARDIGEEIRAGLRARTGEDVPGFVLGSRRRSGGPDPHPPQLQGRFDLGDFGARAAWAPLPATMAQGGINFVSWTEHGGWLVCSGGGPAPWPQPEHPRPAGGGTGGVMRVPAGAERPLSPEEAMFTEVVDDHGQRYRLAMSSSAASSSGSKRQRWDLRLRVTPTPGRAVRGLRFTTPRGPVTASLQAAATAVSAVPLAAAMDTAEFHLLSQLHHHAWLHLLDPERTLGRLAVVAQALVAAGAVTPDHPLVAAVTSLDDAFAGQGTTALPAVVASAVTPRGDQRTWIGCTALGVTVSHPDGGELGLEALVGHPDRLALHFVQPGWQHGQAGAWDLVVTATDDQGRGHVSGTEPLCSPAEGAFHFRPPLAADAKQLNIRLQGPTTVVETQVELTATSAGNGEDGRSVR